MVDHSSIPSTRLQEAYQHLRKMVVSGELKPGTRLVSRTLGQRFQMSTVTIREAIHRLASEGLVDHVPNAGACQLDRSELLKLYRSRDDGVILIGELETEALPSLPRPSGFHSAAARETEPRAEVRRAAGRLGSPSTALAERVPTANTRGGFV